MLPTPQDERRQFYLMPQDVDFSHAAAMFGLAYHRPDDWPSLDEALAGAWRRAGATVIELAVNETDGAQTLQQLLAQVSRCDPQRCCRQRPAGLSLAGVSARFFRRPQRVAESGRRLSRLAAAVPRSAGARRLRGYRGAGLCRVNTLLQSTLNSYNIHKYWLIGYSLGGGWQ